MIPPRELQLEAIKKAKQKFKARIPTEQEQALMPRATPSHIPIDILYTPADNPGFSYLKDLGFPGTGPFTRGIYPTMYRGRLWTMRQLAGFGTAEDTNERIKFLLERGATGVSITFDFPSLRGWESTDPAAEGDAGKGGVAIDSVEDMEALFRDVPIDKISINLVTCQPVGAVGLMAMYFAMAQRRGLSLHQLDGTAQNDFLMEQAITLAPPVLLPENSFKLSCDLIEFCARNVPKWHAVSYAGYNYGQAGMNAVQELAFVFANAIASIEELINRGLQVDSIVPMLSFFFGCGNDFFEEVAKFRAARRVWYRITKERFNAQEVRSQLLRFHVQTSGISLTSQQPLINIARAAYQGLAAVLGGAQSVHIDGYDEALCTPSELAALTALRTQQIIQYETNVASVVDPLGGSYYVECLTNELEKETWAYLARIEEQGGIVSVTRRGWTHREIARSALEYQQGIEEGTIKVVGVNCFTEAELTPIEIFTPPETVERQRQKLDKLRRRRDQAKVQQGLDKLRDACRHNQNVYPAAIEAVDAGVTLGELTNIIREEYGTWVPPLI